MAREPSLEPATGARAAATAPVATRDARLPPGDAPRSEKAPRWPGFATADALAWTGLASAFAAAGFVEVARRSPTRPIVRRRIRATHRHG